MSARKFAAIAFSLAVVFVLGHAEPSSAQCAMCRAALEQEGAEVAAGFNRGILFLLSMPYIVFGSIALSWYWKRRRSGAALGNESPAK